MNASRSPHSPSPHSPSIDSIWLQRVVQLVIARLKEQAASSQAVSIQAVPIKSPVGGGENLVSQRVIDETMVLQHPKNTTLSVGAKALVTPLARDTARDRNIQIMKIGGSRK